MNMRRNKLLWCVIAVLMSMAWAFVASADDNSRVRFTNIGLGHGLSQLSVMKIFQDSKGYMWFATRNGLNKYNGAEMTVYSANDSLGLVDQQVTALAEDRNGNIWIGTSSGMNCLDVATDRMESFRISDYPWLGAGVRAMHVDRRDRFWVGTTHGLYLFVPQARQAQPVTLDGRIAKSQITAIADTPDGMLAIGTERDGLFLCDTTFKKVRHYNVENKLPDNNIADIYVDGEGKSLWIATTGGGIAHLDMTNDSVRVYNRFNSRLSTDNIRVIASGGDILYVGTFDGLYTIDLETDNLEIHSHADSNSGSLSHFSIYSLCVDNSAGLWVGTYSGGVDYLSPYNSRFVLHPSKSVSGNMAGLYGPMVWHDGYLYVATEGGGLLCYSLKDGKGEYYVFEQNPSSNLSHNIVKSLLLEGEDILCGTNDGRIFTFDTRTKKFKDKITLPQSTSIYAMLRSQDGSLWLASSKPSMGLVKIEPSGNVKSEFIVADTVWNPGSLRCLMELRPNVLLIGSRSSGLYIYDEKRGTCSQYSKENGLPNDYVTTILRGHDGRIWVSTFGGGLCEFSEDDGVKNIINTSDGLYDDYISMTVQDKDGNLWISSRNCITSYDPEEGTIRNYRVGNSAEAQEFTTHSGMLMPDGDVGFSASKGFVTFNPNDIYPNPYKPPVVLTSLSINNQIVHPDPDGPLTSELDNTRRIELPHDRNNISISYAALNYVSPDLNSYAYRLKGYDNEWNYVGNRRSAFYTNLSPGEYVFEVKAANNDGVWTDDIRSLVIKVRTPWWTTWWAYTLYAVITIATVVLIAYYIIKKKDLEHRLHYNHLEQERSEEFHKAKIQMFTNFSHELRTPLTLIMSPLEELLRKSEFNSGVKNKLSLIYNNSQRMLILVNQLMDLRKSQSGKMKLKISKDDLCSFMQEVYCAFGQLAEARGVTFGYECTEERLPAWFDKSLCDKVLFNLLSNAFKFTNPGDSVMLALQRLNADDPDMPDSMRQYTKVVHISVADTGRGIPPDDLLRIFDPFYQSDGEKPKDTAGTGIGLSLTKSIVELHHGIIYAENRKDGGAIFHVYLPVGREAYSEDEIDSEAANRVVVDVIPGEAPESLKLERRYTVLLVEDNEEVRAYVKECLEPYFDIIEADNGVTAFDLAVERYPDIIVSDIMMPQRNGLDLCKMIKEDLRTEHIPVILMTARSMVMHIKEGFSSGADDYIVKPFSMDVLIFRIRNILDAREKLKRLYGKKFSPESLGIKINSGDDRFTQKLFGVIEQNISNPDLNIDLICREVGLSRTNLYRKLKAITELSPVELIRNKRLEVAARLLRESDYTVSEIAIQVGFNSHAYFTQCFKSVYGCSPTEFASKETDKTA